MTELPSGWIEAQLADVADVISGQAPPGKSYNESAVGLPLFQGKTDFTDLYIGEPRLWTTEATKLAEHDDVLLSVRAPVGPTNLARERCAIGRGLAAVRGRPGVVQRYLLYALRATASRLESQATGTTFAAITSGVIRRHSIRLAPTAEQKRIVAAIEEQFTRLDAGLAAVERARQNLQRMRASVLQAAITGKLLSGLGTFEERPLSDLIANIHAGKSFKCDERPALPDEWGVVKVSAMTWGEFRESENKTVLPGRHIDERLEIRPGDVLLSRSNTVGYVGAVVKVEHCRPKLLLSDKSLRIVPSPELTPEWLVISLRSKPARRYIEAVATGTSDSMRNISQPKIRALKIPLPTLDEQRRLATEVDRHLAVLTELARTLDALSRRGSWCSSSVLAAAFSGKLVPQDPSEQSASALIEEITAGRAALNGHKPTHIRQRRATRPEVLA